MVAVLPTHCNSAFNATAESSLAPEALLVYCTDWISMVLVLRSAWHTFPSDHLGPYRMIRPHPVERLVSPGVLPSRYRPGCNEQSYEQAWKDEWIGGYSAPTTGPLTTRREPGDRPRP